MPVPRSSPFARAWVLAAAVAAVGGCREVPRGVASDGSPLPDSLHALRLVDLQTGADAARIMERLHGKEVAPLRSWIGSYAGHGASAELYVSRYDSGRHATADLEAMSARIGPGTPVFGHHRTIVVAGQTVHATLGQGGVHYFFVREADLFWLTVSPAVARPALAQLLEVPLDSIPRAAPVGRPAGSG